MNLRFLYTSCLIVIVLCCFSSIVYSQLTGTKSIPGDYVTVNAAVTALNGVGVGAGGVIFNIAANYTETIAATISLTATGTAANTIVFQKDPSTSGANPVITAYTGGTGTPATAVQDGIWRLVGSDYVTIDGIDLKENVANTANPSTMEYGYALYKASLSNGCQYITITNCSITLNKINNAAGVAPMVDGSTGILSVNSTAAAAITVLVPTTAAGTNSNNSFYSNTIQNCNTGIAVIGYAAASPFAAADQNNDVGGTTVATGNTIINFGGAAGATIAAVAIRTLAQYGLNVSYNTINNNNGSGNNHETTLRGIYINTATSAASDITYNTITLKSGATTQVITAIENASGSTAVGNEVNISNNTVSNSSYTTATTGSFYGIYNIATPAFLTVNNNTFINNSTAATATGVYYPIYNNGSVTTTININNNTVNGIVFSAATSIAFTSINNTASGTSANLSISNNNFTGINYPALSTANNTYISNSVATLSQVISSNTFTNLNVNTTGSITFISNSVVVPATGNQVVDDNVIVGTFTRTNTATSGTLTLFTSSATNATGSVISNSNNDFSNITVSGAATIAGWINTDAGSSLKTIQGNIFSNWMGGTGTITALTVNITGTTNATVDNLISNINSAGIITGISTGAGNDNIYSNTINTLSSTGGSSTTVTGIAVSGGTTKNIYQNNISGLTANSSTTGNATTLLSVNGIWISAGATVNAYENKISGLTANAITTGTINGITITGGTAIAAYRNKIYDLSSGSNAIITLGGVNGVQVSGSTASTTITIRNNIIGDLRATAASIADPIRGISLISAGLTSNLYVYYNTIYLNAVSSGANFGSTGIYHTTSTTATTATLELRNNIITNVSTPNGTGLTVAYRRSTNTLANYGSTSNNNLFYAGTPGSNRLIFYDFTNSDQTLAAYKTRVGTRDAASISEDLIAGGIFLSTVGSSVNYLHMDDTKPSGVKSGAVNIPGITLDFDNDIRQGNAGYAGTGTAPDIGADEYAGISYLPLSGSYNVGTGQTYTSLTNAGGLFARINHVGLSGNVTFNITSDLTENGTEVLNSWTETGAGNYNLTIQPDATTPRIISGDVLAGMIRLNGVDRLKIDGGAGRYLTFRNTNTSGTTGSAITFINGASNNTIRYCNIEAFTNATNAVVLFSTSATYDGGNSNNLIEYCNINGTVGTNNSVVNILSAGTNVSGFENTNNSILNNNIYNYRERGMEIKSTGSYGWTIFGNSFYNGSISGGITYASASTLHGIRILGGSGYTVTNNYIGGSAASATGSNATYATSAGNVSYQGILLTTSSATPESNIKGNTIAKINITSFPTASSSTAFFGIETNGSNINIGGTGTGDGNLIGSNSVNSSIVVTTSTATSTYTSLIRGIYCNSSGGAVIGNKVGGIDIKNIGTAPSSSTFLGIYVNNAAAPSKVNNNIIGSYGAGAATNSIQVLSSSTATKTALTGIYIGTSVGSAIQLDSNIIKNISQLSNAVTLTTGGIIGINTAAKNTAEITITHNSFANNTSSSTMTTGLFYGIQNTGASATLKINNNTLTGNTIASTTSVYNAIRNTGAVFNFIEINGNAIGNTSTAAINFSAANSGTQVFINNTGGSPAASLSISNNDIQNINYSAGNGSGANTYISNTAATLSQSITSNSFTNLNVQTIGNTTFISNSVIVPAGGSQNVNNNFISGTYTKKAGGTVTLLTSSATCQAGSTITISNNNFSYITVSLGTTLNGLVNTDAGNSSKIIQGNIFTNWTGGTSAITVMTVNLTGTNNATSGNIIRNISSAGAVTGVTTGAGNDNINTNTIDSLFSSGGTSTVINGINVTAGTTKNIYQNTISNLQGNSITTGSVQGIFISAGTTINFYQNKIYGLTANALTSGTVNGISITAGTTIKTYRNKIYDLSSTSSALTGEINGIQVSGATTNLTCIINNNIIGDLRAPAAVLADPIRGISVVSSGLTSTSNVYNNTVYLNAGSGGTNFGSSGIYHLVNATATTSALNLINNSITNVSVPRGTGLTVAYRRSGNILSNYGSTSNNNMLYAGTPAASNLIYYDGTNSDQTIAAFKARVATRDAASISEDLITGSVFLSTTGSSVSYLHIDPNKTTALKSGGINISGFTDDFDGDIRFGNAGYAGNGTAPDIGADEFAGLQILPFAGIYNVGTGQNYTSLTNSNGIFSKINSLGFSGNVTINIISDLSETGAEALNQWSETGTGNYTLTIQPSAASARLISGNVLAGMIRLNGADRVKLDGGSGRYLTFRNTNSTGSTGTALTFINGAANDTVRYCNLEAYANANNGVVLFSTSTVSANGNSNNLLEYNSINGTVSSNTSIASVYSSGTTGKENANNVISNNTIYDYRDAGIDITATGSTGWTISGNSFYNGNASLLVNYPASSELHGIRILGGSGYTVLNNYIGGNALLASGTNAAYTSTLGNISFKGILLTTSSATPGSSVKGNTIAKISLNAISISASSNAFTGIETNGSGINMGGTLPGEGNLVGSNATNGSITVTTSTTSTSYSTVIRGINCLSTGGVVTANQIGSFDINNGGTAPAPSAFNGIYINNVTAPTQVNSNIIGSAGSGAASNSIRVIPGSSALTNSISGIELGDLVASAVQLNSNIIQNVANLSTSSSGSFTGINNTATAAGAVVTISNNLIKYISAASNININSTIYTGISSGSPSTIITDTISNISYAATGTAAQIRGIIVTGAFIHSISGNLLSDFSTASTKVAGAESSTPSDYTITGIINSASVAGQGIYGNTLTNFLTTTTDVTNTAIGGIGITTAGSSGNIYKNRINSFINTSTGTSSLPAICGIIAANGTFNVYNNAIKLDNGSNSNGIRIFGIHHFTVNTWNYYYNTVSIGGTAAGAAARSAAFIRTVNGSLVLKNNIFFNTRTGTSSNYSISNKVAAPSTNWSSDASNYNDLYSSNTSTTGEWGNGGNNTFAQWKLNSGGDANSVNSPVSFIASSYDMEPANNSNCNLNNAGTPISTPIVINTDLKTVSRNATAPDLGAYEFSYTVFTVTAGSNSPVCSGGNVNLTSNASTLLATTYSWTNPASVIISTLQNPTVAASAGQYTVTVTDINGCSADPVSTTVVVTAPPNATISYASSPYCGNGGSASVTFSGTTGGAYSSTTGLSINSSTGAVTLATSADGTYMITYTVIGGCSTYSTTTSIIIKALGKWLGTVSADWNAASNWQCGIVPSGTLNVTIQFGVINYPTINSGTVAVNNISILSGGSLTVTGATLQIAGTISNSGTLSAGNGTVHLNGNAAQLIPAATFSGNVVKNITINNNAGVALAGSLNLTGILKVTVGQFNTGGYLTLISTATQTALIDGSGAGEVLGNVTMQRYLPSGFGYKYFSSPFQAATVNEFSNDINLGAAFPSFYRYNQNLLSSGWVNYTNISGILNPGEGYAANLGSSSSAKTVDITGIVNNNTIAASTLYNNNRPYTQGFNLVGNPYPSPIDWNASSGWSRGNIDNAVYYFNTGSSNQYTGTYSTYINGVSSDGVAGNIIGAMQGFFVHVSNGAFPVAATLSLNNNVRINNLSPDFHRRTSSNLPLLRLSAGFEDVTSVSDPLVVYFEEAATPAFDKAKDALKLFNTDSLVPNLYAIASNAAKLSIAAWPVLPDSTKIIPLGLQLKRAGFIAFNAHAIENIPLSIYVYLLDATTNTYHDLRQHPLLSMYLQPGEYSNRFSIIFSKIELGSITAIVGTLNVYSLNGKLFVNASLSSGENGNLVVFNTGGQVVYKKQLNGGGLHEINTNLITGLYIVSLTTKESILSKKVFIENQ